MDIITILVVLIIVGVLMWLVERFVPMDATFKQLFRAVAVIAVVLWILVQFLGAV